MNINIIKVNDILNIPKHELGNFKIRISPQYKDKETEKVYNPLDLYLNKKEEFYEFVNWRKEDGKSKNKYTLDKKYVIHFIKMGRSNKFLFVGIHKVLGGNKRSVSDNGFLWETEEDTKYAKFSGKLVCNFHRPDRSRNVVISADKIYGNNSVLGIDLFTVNHLSSNLYDGIQFDGYENVDLSFPELKSVISNEITSWKTALSSIKGVYVITDTNNGKLYVGKAIGEDMLWQRWKAYCKTCHGGNTSLIELYNSVGEEYFETYMRFSILEVFKCTTDDAFVDFRENHWKRVLDTRKHGYNDN